MFLKAFLTWILINLPSRTTEGTRLQIMVKRMCTHQPPYDVKEIQAMETPNACPKKAPFYLLNPTEPW